MKEYAKYSKSAKKPIDIPSRPQLVYKNEWKGALEWLGKSKVKVFRYNSFENAKNIVRELGLSSGDQYRKAHKEGKFEKLPYHPERTYKEQWMGWKDFLVKDV